MAEANFAACAGDPCSSHTEALRRKLAPSLSAAPRAEDVHAQKALTEQPPSAWDEGAAHEARTAAAAAAAASAPRDEAADAHTARVREALLAAARRLVGHGEREGPSTRATNVANYEDTDLARLVMCSPNSEIHALPTKLRMITRTWEPREALNVVSEGRWTSEHGPMVTAASASALSDQLGATVPPWGHYSDVCERAGGDSSRRHIKRGALLSVGDLRQKNPRSSRPASWVFEQFETPPERRTNLLNVIHSECLAPAHHRAN